MPTTFSAPTFDVLARRALACLVLAGALPAAAATIPQPVSPGAQSAGVVAEARCPTFSWAGVPGARGYELAVFRVSDTPGAQPVLVTRASVPGDARAFTPPVGQCLERGQRYAWSVAVAGDAPDWSPPFLFEIEAAPSLEEVEQAIATLQRYREHHLGDELAAPTSAIAAADVREPLGGGSSRAPLSRRERPTPVAADRPLPRALASPRTGVIRVASAATPTLGIPSLKVSANVALGASSNLFKDDSVFLWDDTTGNTAVGRSALASASGSATGNTALGRAALRNATGGAGPYSGSYNTSVGDRALFANTTGFFNTASGASALHNNTTGFFNTASGYAALVSNTTGERNAALGAYALFYNTTGHRNTATGMFALRNNTTGYRNTASGYAALNNNTTGERNTATGNLALFLNTTGDRNTASGALALYANTTGTRNTASGYAALRSNTTGISNTASGESALRSNTIGFDNTASGYAALRSNTSGALNTANGAGALRDNTTGYSNTASGESTLSSNTTGDRNTASGHYALRSNTTGNRNTALGDLAGYLNETGSDSIFINNYGAEADTATIKIGKQGTQTRTFIAGIRGATINVNALAVLIDSAGQLGTILSSREVKQDIQDLGPLADRLLELRPVVFRYKQHVASDPETPLQFGLIAEEVAEVFPELVVYDEEGRPETVKYHLLSSLLLGELQKQHGELQEQRGELRVMRARLDALESRSPSSHPQPRGGR